MLDQWPRDEPSQLDVFGEFSVGLLNYGDAALQVRQTGNGLFLSRLLDVEKRDAEGLNYEALAICRGSP